MNVWRISKERYALDKLGIGSSKSGGRWNPVNVPVIYAGMTIEIASFEKLVHVEGDLPNDLVLVKIEIPDNAPIWDVPVQLLPEHWDASPSSSSAVAFGKNFIEENSFLGMIIPSVIIPEARNIVINPSNEYWASCKMTIERKFMFDSRLGKLI